MSTATQKAYEPFPCFVCSVGLVMTNGARHYYQAWRRPNQWRNWRVGGTYITLEEAIRSLMYEWLTEMGL